MTCLPRTRGSVGRPARPLSWQAFTLIELLTVITIIGILSGIVIGVGRHAAESGKVARAQVEMASISTALESYKRQCGDYPRTASAPQLLQALMGKLGPTLTPLNPSGRVLLDMALFTTDGAGDPLTDSSLSLADPWGNPYRYAFKVTGGGWTNSSFVLYSIGPDEQADQNLAPGGYPHRELPLNLDNIYANF
ncbi:MAG: prepilin-type N-terminal cleavage/methylation domain-containing protein [Cephaloticoccus sp.]|nr:prepilin-type N-terminal cleavage/methylation domain-containing protein [Cephaloticoccus sp.]MCF7761460.1 prepilin-type N-terminal cleavage/methylation domain-containing protein [Cephaloticoccus sp.]